MFMVSFMDDLLTPEQAAAIRGLEKTVDRCARKRSSDREDKRKLEVWRDGVWDRDKSKCRCCGADVVRNFYSPRRGECHHIAGRRIRPLRWDVRNGVLLCADPCHLRATGTIGVKVTIAQADIHRFELVVGGHRYIDATHPLEFIRNAKETQYGMA